MSSIWFNSLLSVIIVSLISLIGIISLAIKINKLKNILFYLVAFAAGAILGDIFIHLLPELSTSNGLAVGSSSLFILLGILIFFVLEKIICWRHCHVLTSSSHPHSLSMMNLIGDSIHNFTDGVIIATAYLINFQTGLATTLAVIFHEIPQEIADFSVLIYAGFSRKKAIFLNFLSALVAVLGTILTLSLGSHVGKIMDFLLPITIGGFLYIASADFIPELKKEEGIKKSIGQFLSLLSGILLMKLIK